MLKSFHSPSTTVRIPRDLQIYNKYKGSEYRSMLLIFYPIFEDFLPKKYYDHLKLLVFAAHIGENREIEKSDLETMHFLLYEFVKKFHLLYGERHCVNTIHSIIHFAETVRDYGPLQCYSTFNYESILGKVEFIIKSYYKNIEYFEHNRYSCFCIPIGAITSTIHGCRNQDKEIFNNVEMLRQSSYMALEESQQSLLYEYMMKLVQKRYRESYFPGEFITTKPIQLQQDEVNYLQVLYSTEKIQVYYRCEYEKVNYSSFHWKESKFDAAVLFRKRKADKLKFAIIDKFIVCEYPQKKLIIQIYELEDEYCDSVFVNNITVENSNTAIGQINFTLPTQILPTQIVEKVFFLRQKNQFMFIRLPNESESS
jgi:hypothetical protein